MRPAVMPENLLERIALFSGLVPTPLFNIIRTVPPEQAAKIINRAFQSLDQAGTVVILDSEHSGEENNLSATAGFNELFFFLINGTKVYPQDLIRNWLSAARFTNPKNKKLLRMPMPRFLTAQKPAG